MSMIDKKKFIVRMSEENKMSSLSASLLYDYLSKQGPLSHTDLLLAKQNWTEYHFVSDWLRDNPGYTTNSRKINQEFVDYLNTFTVTIYNTKENSVIAREVIPNQIFHILVRETLSKVVQIAAKDSAQAEDIAENMWLNNEIELNYLENGEKFERKVLKGKED